MISMLKRMDVYHLILIFLIVSGLSAVYLTQNVSLLIQLILAPVLAAIADVAMSCARRRQKTGPLTAVISGLIIALILPLSPFHVTAFAVLVAIVSKHAIRWRDRNVFNPAALGILAAAAMFSIGTSWWISASFLSLLGFLVVYRLGRLRTSTVFLIVYFLLVYATGHQLLLDLTAIFFATIMLIEPKTSPHTKNGKIVFGAAAAVLVTILQSLQLGKDPFLAGLLVLNLFTGVIDRKTTRQKIL